MDLHIACPCPGAPHPDGDTVTFKDTLGFRDASMVITMGQTAFREEKDELLKFEAGQVGLTEGYLLIGVESWTLVDEAGEPIEVTRQAVRERLLTRPDLAIPLADEIGDAYETAVVLPLTVLARRSSPVTPMTASTSATNGSLPPRPKRSKQSSTSTSRTDDTETMSASPDGVYSFSPKSVSAAS